MDLDYQRCYEQLHTTLGHVTAGGVVICAAHIGASAVAELGATTALDLLLVVEPFPLTEPQLAALQGLGYTQVASPVWTKGQLFHHPAGQWLYLHGWADEHWYHHLLVRDYLRQSSAARQSYLTAQQQEGVTWKATLFPALITAAQAWWVAHDHFASLQRLVADLATYPHRWTVSSGWALDLFLGQVTRYHEDVDIVVDRQQQLDLQQHLAAQGWRWVTPYQGKLEAWPPHMRLELPRHQAHAHRLHGHGEDDLLDFLFTDFQQDIWRYRREPSIVQTVERAILTTPDGVRYLAPEIVLLFKSRNTGTQERTKDQTDFERVLPHLAAPQRAWLRWALLVTQPNHPWLGQL